MNLTWGEWTRLTAVLDSTWDAGKHPRGDRGRFVKSGEARVRAARILQGKPVADLSSSIVPQTGAADVRRWAAAIFEKQGGKANNPEIGTVALDMRAVRDSMGHGKPSRFKYAAFAAVKDVLEHGAVVHHGQRGRDGESFYVAAPVKIDGADDVVTVLVHRDPNSQRMYLHSVSTKESLLSRRVSGTDTFGGVERSGSSDSGDVAIVLRDLLNFKGSGNG